VVWPGSASDEEEVAVSRIRSGLIAAGVGALSITVAACGAGNPGKSSGGGGSKSSSSIVVGTTDKVVSIDPAGAYDNGSNAVQTQVYSYLMNFPEGKTKPQPDAAKKCEFTKPKQYTCTMKSGLKFANGDPLTAKSAAFSFKRVRKIKDPNGPASLLANMKSVKADGNKVVFTLKSANDQTFPQILATSTGPIVDEKVYPSDKTLPDKKVVSSKATSGPYMITKYQKNKLAEFKKNPNYKGLYGKPKTDNVTMKYFTHENNLKLNIQHKNIDVAFRSLTPTDVASLKKTKGITVHKGAGGESRYMVFNLKTMPGKNKKQKLAIRKAMASSLDRAAISKQVYKGTTVGEYSLVPASQRGATKPFKKLYGTKPNKAKAAKYLSDAGVKKPVKLTIWYNPDHYGSSSSEEYNAVKRQLEDTGLFKVKLQSAEWNTYNEERVKDSYPIYQLGWFPDFPDPDNYLSPFLGPDNFVKSHYKDKKMTKMLQSETTDSNEQSRMKTIGKIQKREAEQIPYLPLLTASQVAVSKDDIKGVGKTLDASFKFRFTSLHR
jgi:peptide/nickel transport system substrate-binding protein